MREDDQKENRGKQNKQKRYKNRNKGKKSMEKNTKQQCEVNGKSWWWGEKPDTKGSDLPFRTLPGASSEQHF